MSDPSSTFDAATLIRRAVFFLCLFGLALIHLFITFRGLGTAEAMDQAQLGRQIARGEGFATKVIRPLELHLAESHSNSPVPMVGLRDTYQSPLNPLVLGAVFKLVGADQPDKWTMPPKELIYELDRVVALVSTLFFLMAIGVTYLLVSRIFDAKIAGFTAVLMLFCDMYWRFSQSGMPQMLLLLLFSCGLYFAYRAIEEQEEGKGSYLQPLLAAVFFSLMVLTHWLTAWVFFGFLIYAAIAFRPRGIVALSSLVVLLVFVAVPLARMANITGQPFGVARFVFYNGLSAGSESAVMRTLDLSSTPLVMNGLLLKIFATTLVQASNLVPFLGGILAAPVFFVALLHPFKRTSIAKFRWMVALMWLFAAIGMAIFGIDSFEDLHPNQIHLLFAPVMAAYGLAFLSILWSRLNVATTVPFLRDAHYYAIVILSAAPLLLSLPREVRTYLLFVDKGGIPQWPPYYPLLLNKGLSDWVDKRPDSAEIVVSDQPWATAWYADVTSLWLPKTIEDFDTLETKAIDQGNRFAGILISPSSRNDGSVSNVISNNEDFAALILDGSFAKITGPTPKHAGQSLYDKAPVTQPLYNRFPYRYSLIPQELMYYSEKKIRNLDAGN
ncbi:ArnT family glycosyltransferase [Haloferula sargassicola]|uniref:Glycosyltransferase RgtA/B/C/D-like domain-containing protein n=1 Tax=Haloferula sargassicola TaxID=490096 RepID=A0ABP9ULY7_9BACT